MYNIYTNVSNIFLTCKIFGEILEKLITHMFIHICTMKHRGEIVQNAIKLSGVTVAEVARKLDYTRRSMYNFFEDRELSFDIIVKIGQAIKHDFRIEFPELFIEGVQEPVPEYTTVKEAWIQRDEWKLKYYSLMEDYNELSKKYEACLEGRLRA